MRHPITRERVHQALRSTCVALLMTLATLAAIEIVLRVVDLRILREAKSERSLAYGYDAELGWAPIPNSSSSVTTERTIHAHHNSLGLRDIEFERDARPTMLFLGDSFVLGRRCRSRRTLHRHHARPHFQLYHRERGRFRVWHGSGISLAAATLAEDRARGGRADVLHVKRPAG